MAPSRNASKTLRFGYFGADSIRIAGKTSPALDFAIPQTLALEKCARAPGWRLGERAHPSLGGLAATQAPQNELLDHFPGQFGIRFLQTLHQHGYRAGSLGAGPPVAAADEVGDEQAIRSSRVGKSVNERIKRGLANQVQRVADVLRTGPGGIGVQL